MGKEKWNEQAARNNNLDSATIQMSEQQEERAEKCENQADRKPDGKK